MGYTHYWYRPALLAESKFREFVALFKKALPKLRACNLCASYDHREEKPIANVHGVAFNGKEAPHEDFEILRAEAHRYPPAPGERAETHIFTFCKTARNPYDLAVCVALILFKRAFGADVKVSSDGSAADWQPAFDFVKKHFGVNSSFEEITARIPCGVGE